MKLGILSSILLILLLPEFTLGKTICRSIVINSDSYSFSFLKNAIVAANQEIGRILERTEKYEDNLLELNLLEQESIRERGEQSVFFSLFHPNAASLFRSQLKDVEQRKLENSDDIERAAVNISRLKKYQRDEILNWLCENSMAVYKLLELEMTLKEAACKTQYCIKRLQQATMRIPPNFLPLLHLESVLERTYHSTELIHLQNELDIDLGEAIHNPPQLKTFDDYSKINPKDIELLAYRIRMDLAKIQSTIDKVVCEAKGICL